MKTIARILRCLRLRPTLVATFPALLLAITPGSLQAQPVVKTLTGGWWQYNTTTFYGNTNGNTFAVAQFNFPSGLALDLSGSTLYVADFTNNTVRQISNLGDITNSLTTTFAGTNKGIWRPVAVAVDSTNGIYVLNRSTNGNTGTVLKFDTAGNLIRTNAAGLTNATALALDSLNNLYVTIKSNTVMRITAAATNYYTITNAGTSLRGITVLDDGRLALTDSGNNGIWLLNPLTTNYTKLTGFHGTGDTNGAAAVAAFKRPEMIAKAGNGILVVADRGSHKVKLVDSLTGYVTNFYGVSSNLWVPGPGTIQNPIFPGWWDGTVTNVDVKGTVEAREPLGVLVAPDGSVYTTEVYYHIIRHVTATGLIGPQPSTLLGIALDAADENLFIADATNNIVRALNFANNQTTTYLDSGDGISYPVDVALDADDNLFVLNQDTGSNGYILSFDQWHNFLGTNATGLTQPTALALDGTDNIFITELTGAVRAFTPGGSSTTLATITNAGVQLQGIAILDDGNLAVSDAGNHVVWQVNPITKVISRLTGQLGLAGTNFGSTNFARLNQPGRLTRLAGNKLLAADSGNHRLVVIQRSGSITNALISTNSTVWYGRSGDPVTTTNSQWVAMNSPLGVAVSSSGTAYSSETLRHVIRGINGTGLAKAGAPPFNILPFFFGPAGIALSASGNTLFIADQPDNSIFQLNLTDNSVTTFTTNNLNLPAAVIADSADNLYVLNQGTGADGAILKFNKFGNLVATNATGLLLPTAIALDGSANLLICELAGNIKRIPTGTNTVTTLATITNAGAQLRGIAVKDDGTIAVTDAGNHAVFLVNPVTFAQTLLTGNNGPGNTVGTAAFAQLNQPHHLVKAGGGLLVVADYNNDRVVVVDSAGTVNNLPTTNSIVWFGRAGDPVPPGDARYIAMRLPAGIAIAGNGDVFTGELFSQNIRKISPTGLLGPGVITSPGTTNALVLSPSFTPNTGYFPMGHVITVFSAVPDVFYTTDGTDPTTDSTRVTINGNVGNIVWNNPARDLTSLRVRAYSGTNSSIVVAGLPAATNNIGIPTSFYPVIQAGVGATVILPVVVNLRTNDQIKSFQFNVELSPNGGAPALVPGFDGMSISSNDFVHVVTAAQGGDIAYYSVQPYTVGVTNGLIVTAIATNANVSFQNYAVVALLKVPVPNTAANGQSYNLQVFYPSATSDGNQTPVALRPVAGTTILVTNVFYTVGDCAPGAWYNAGDFGNTDLANNDVNTIFYASTGLRLPPLFSDVYDAMDAFPEDDTGFVGGDGQIRYLDWQTILYRSQRLATNNWKRAWDTGGYRTNSGPIALPEPQLLKAAKATAAGPGSVWYRQAAVGALSVGNAAAGGTVNVPVFVKVVPGASLAGLQFRAIVTPGNTAPALTQNLQFIPADGVTAPVTQSFRPGELAVGWSLATVNYPAQSSNIVGWLRFTMPALAQAGQTYTVTFANTDGAPDRFTPYDFETRHAVIGVGIAAPGSDFISDEWKLHYFGSLASAQADPNADPDGDGSPNWEEFLNGTAPDNALSKLKLAANAVQTVGKQKQLPLHWLSAPGKIYAVERTASLTAPAWSNAGNIAGDGYEQQFTETNLGSGGMFYRVRVISAP